MPCLACVRHNAVCETNTAHESPRSNQVAGLQEEVQALVAEVGRLGAEAVAGTLETASQVLPGVAVVFDHPLYTLALVTLTRAQIETYYQRFHTHFLPLFPVLNPAKPFQQHYAECPLLFWTIVFVASLADRSPSQTYLPLSTHVRTLVISTCWLDTPRSTFVVQALLLLTTWPLPLLKLLDDVLYRLAGLAHHLGLQLGMHRGPFVNEFLRGIKGKDVRFRTKAWQGIFVNTQYWSSHLGLPSAPADGDFLMNQPVGGDDEVEHSGPLSSPGVQRFYFRVLVEILKTVARFTQVLGNSLTTLGLISYNERFLNLHGFDRELEQLEARVGLPAGPPVTKAHRLVHLQLQFARIQLYLYALFPNTHKNDQRLYIAKQVAVCVDSAQVLWDLLLAEPDTHILMYPVHVRFMAQAVCYQLARIQMFPYCPSKQLGRIQQALARVYSVLGYTSTGSAVFREWSSVDTDCRRCVKVLRNFEVLTIVDPEFVVRQPYVISHMQSHLSALLYYELVWFVHELRRRQGGGISDNSANSTPLSEALASPQLLHHPLADERVEHNLVRNGVAQMPFDEFVTSHCGLDPADPTDARLVHQWKHPRHLFSAEPAAELGMEALVQGAQWVTPDPAME